MLLFNRYDALLCNDPHAIAKLLWGPNALKQILESLNLVRPVGGEVSKKYSTTFASNQMYSF